MQKEHEYIDERKVCANVNIVNASGICYQMYREWEETSAVLTGDNGTGASWIGARHLVRHSIPVVLFQVEHVTAVVQKRVAHVSHFVPGFIASTSSGPFVCCFFRSDAIQARQVQHKQSVGEGIAVPQNLFHSIVLERQLSKWQGWGKVTQVGGSLSLRMAADNDACVQMK